MCLEFPGKLSVFSRLSLEALVETCTRPTKIKATQIQGIYFQKRSRYPPCPGTSRVRGHRVLPGEPASSIGRKRAMPLVLARLAGAADRRQDEAEFPVPIVEHSEPPDHLSPVAAELWTSLMSEIGPLRVVSTLDLTALEMLCEAYADWCAAREYLDKSTRYYTVTDAQGNERHYVHPAAGILSDADRRLRVWMLEFGLTPSARAKWRAPKIGRRTAEERAEDESLDLSSLSPHERDQVRAMVERRTGATEDAEELA